MNGGPLPPQHGFPLRLVVPDWYGMASVKWLRSITAVDKPFSGVQQALKYRYKRSGDDPGVPVTRKRPRALMVDRKSTRLNSSHANISYAGFCLKKKK